MLRCLFWNQRRNNLACVAEAAAKTMHLDILATCETIGDHRKTLEALNRVDSFHFTTGLFCQRFHVFTKFHKSFVSVRNEAERYLILEVALPARDRFLLMLLHAPSKRAGWTSTANSHEITSYATALRDAQRDHKVPHAVVVGDFNANPFDPGLVAASAFNSVMDSRQAKKKQRTVQGKEYSYFYNPMWNFLGDRTPGPPASLFYDANTQVELQWHMIDQVIVSSSMIEYLDVSKIRLLETIGDHELANQNGRPKKAVYSDHFPLYFELSL